MKLTTLRENLYLLRELEEAAANVRYGIDEVNTATEVKAEMFFTQVKNFVDDITKTVIATYHNDGPKD